MKKSFFLIILSWLIIGSNLCYAYDDTPIIKNFQIDSFMAQYNKNQLSMDYERGIVDKYFYENKIKSFLGMTREKTLLSFQVINNNLVLLGVSMPDVDEMRMKYIANLLRQMGCKNESIGKLFTISSSLSLDNGQPMAFYKDETGKIWVVKTEKGKTKKGINLLHFYISCYK